MENLKTLMLIYKQWSQSLLEAAIQAVYKSGTGTRGRGTSGLVCGDLGLEDARRGT